MHVSCAGLLNLFGGVLSQKRRAERALEESGIAYTIVRPGGMERPTDTYKLTHNVRLAPRDTWFGGLVSRLQVAELVANAVSNAALSENKVGPPASVAWLQGVSCCHLWCDPQRLDCLARSLNCPPASAFMPVYAWAKALRNACLQMSGLC